MDVNQIITGILVDETTAVSFVSVCQQVSISEDVLLAFLEQGLFPDVTAPNKELEFNGQMIKRLQSAYRLYQDLSINPPGVVLALELLDTLEQIKQELDVLQHHVRKV